MAGNKWKELTFPNRKLNSVFEVGRWGQIYYGLLGIKI